MEISISDDLPEDFSVPVHTDRQYVEGTAVPNAGDCYLHFIHHLHVEFNWLFPEPLWLGLGLRNQTTDWFDRNSDSASKSWLGSPDLTQVYKARSVLHRLSGLGHTRSMEITE